MSVAGPVFVWLCVFAVFAEICAWMVGRWGGP